MSRTTQCSLAGYPKVDEASGILVVHVNDPRFTRDIRAVYIGRAVSRALDTRCRADSLYANPFRVGRSLFDCGLGRTQKQAASEVRMSRSFGRPGLIDRMKLDPMMVVRDNRHACELFEAMVRLCMDEQMILPWRARIRRLGGRTLGCWCCAIPEAGGAHPAAARRGKECHGHVLVRLYNELRGAA